MGTDFQRYQSLLDPNSLQLIIARLAAMHLKALTMSKDLSTLIPGQGDLALVISLLHEQHTLSIAYSSIRRMLKLLQAGPFHGCDGLTYILSAT